TAKLDGPAADDITASLTLGGNATQGSDYGNLQVKINGEWKDYTDSITLPKDGSAVELRVPVKDDKLAESDETVSVTVSTTSDLVTDKSDTASGTIEDDDSLVITTTSIKLSEEGLSGGIKDTTVSEDTIGNPGDTKVDNGDDASMGGKVTLNVQNPNGYVVKFATDDSGAPVPSSYPLEINGNDYSIYWSFENNVLVGHQNGVKVLSIEISSTPNAKGEFEYTVTLHDSIVHPLTDEGGQGIEDVLTSINVGINVYESGKESSGEELNSPPSLIDISVDDDMVDLSPEFSFVEAKVNKSDDKEIIKDFSEFKNTTQTSLKLGIDGNSITFTAINKQGSEANIKVTGQGLGVLSGVPGDGNDNEIEFDDGLAETVIGSLENIAYSISLKLGDFADGRKADDNESGVIVFYRNGTPVASYSFEEADLLNRPESDQTGVISFDIPAGFDEFHITPTDPKGYDDDSDFTLEGISISNVKSDGLATANGTISVNYGADGKGTSPVIYSMTSSTVYDFVKNSDNHWSITPKGSNVILGDVYLQENGDWSFTQYAPITENITFKLKATDGDGDSDKVNVTVKPVNDGSFGNIIESGGGNDTYYLNKDNPNANLQPPVNWQVEGAWGEVNGVIFKPEFPGGSITINADVLNANTSDYVNSGAGNDHVEAGIGDDFILLGDSGNETANLNTAKEYITDHLSDLFNSDSSNDKYVEDGTLLRSASQWADFGNGGEGNDTIYGQAGIDLIFGGSGNDRLFGGADEDFFRGGSGDDLIDGGSEDDWLRGDSGNDTLTGGTGADTYYWGNGDTATDEVWVDTITDFNIAEGDTLNLGDLLQANSIVTASDENGSMVINIDLDGDGDFEQHIVLDGVSVDNGQVVVNTNSGDLIITDTNNSDSSTAYQVEIPDID
ncbi:calcium-binding protein, partial [Enterovibrio baiacu]|uniref:calcium-binding protein n=1 Tax=Enterovibrio baiacu TaxID=2491023 RepID=UPI003D0B662F